MLCVAGPAGVVQQSGKGPKVEWFGKDFPGVTFQNVMREAADSCCHDRQSIDDGFENHSARDICPRGMCEDIAGSHRFKKRFTNQVTEAMQAAFNAEAFGEPQHRQHVLFCG